MIFTVPTIDILYNLKADACEIMKMMNWKLVDGKIYEDTTTD
jgi:hypothetical protein